MQKVFYLILLWGYGWVTAIQTLALIGETTKIEFSPLFLTLNIIFSVVFFVLAIAED